MTRFTALLLAPVLGLWAATAQAVVIHVPKDEPTLQAAVATAKSGDTIMVGAGRWCGADIRTNLTLVGRGDAVIVGGSACAAGPTVDNYRVGLYLGREAGGTTIRHLAFDGTGADTDPEALAYAVYGDDVDHVRIEHVTVRGTVTAFVNRGGDDWRIRHADISGVSARGSVGGRGIALLARAEDDRPIGTSISDTDVLLGRLNPDGTSAGVYLAGAGETEVRSTRVRARSLEVQAVGVLVTSARFGSLPPPPTYSPPPPAPGVAGLPPPPPPPPPSIPIEVASDGAHVTNNDGRRVSYVLVVHPGNAVGLEHRANLGVTVVEGERLESGDGRHADRRTRDGDDD